MTVFVHVGYPKTGTTWLQKTVFPSHPEINFRPTVFVEWLEEITAADFGIHNKRAVVVSNEGLASDSLWLHSRLGKRAKIIIILREQVSMIESLYRQFVAEGGTESFSEFLEQYLPDGAAREYLDYHRSVGLFRSLFGDGNVFVGLFEQLQENPGAFLSDLAWFMEINPFSLPEKDLKGKENVRLSAASEGLARFANKRLKRDVKSVAKRREWLKLADRMMFSRASSRTVMDEEIRSSVESLYRPGNRALAANLGLPLEKYGYPI